MNSPLSKRSWLALALALLLMPSMVSAQTLGTIQGYVTDSSNGSAIPGVTVSVRNVETGTVRTVFTNATGFFAARSLQSGPYEVTASLEGMQTVRREKIQLLTGQVIDSNLSMGVEDVSEEIVVTSEAPLVEVSRSSAASYVSAEEIEALPIVGRDFKDFALLAPTVQSDSIRGFITVSGQRGMYTGLNIDGTSGKSAFFAYGRGGEATENDGLVIAQDSVKEFQVITNGFAPEYSENSGGYINVVTQSGTNQIKGTAFYFLRDDSLAEDIPGSPLDDARGNDGSRPVDEFEIKNYGFSIGGPIAKDKTHFFFSYDQNKSDEPFTSSLNTPGVYDAVLQRAQTLPGLAALVDGYDRNADGTATGLFLRSVDNQIYFGKLDHQFNQSNSLSLRANITDYERASTFQDEESLKVEDTSSFVGALVSVIGDNAVNEFRVQVASDQLDRLSQRVGQEVEAQIRFRFGSRDSVGKFDFLPILVEEDKLQVQNNFSYLFGDHDLKFGFDFQQDDLAQLFAGSLDGRYDFTSIENFLNNEASNVRIYFGDVSFPNYDETQEIFGLYAQDSYKPNAKLTLNFGLRYSATYNPDGLEHLFAEGREIPDDTDNIAPRFGFAYSLGDEGRDVFRGGLGLFHGRTPSLLFASQVQQNGLFPNFGRVNVQPGDIGFVPLGESINNENPPPDAPNSPAYVDPGFEDAETWRLNLGYEKQLGAEWAASADLIFAQSDNLASNIELNRTILGFDDFGRPFYDFSRPQSQFNEIFTRQSVGESEYVALTLKAQKRWNGRYQLQAHYTWSEDKDTDSNERTATDVTVTDPNDIRFDWGLSERDVKHRVLISGVVLLPWDIKLSGILELRSGRPYTPTDAFLEGGTYCPFTLGFNCTDILAVVDGQLVERNSARNESVSRVDLRLSKAFKVGNWTIDLYGEAFNLFDENSFAVAFGQRQPTTDGITPDPEFGIPDTLVTDPRQFQIGARISFR